MKLQRERERMYCLDDTSLDAVRESMFLTERDLSQLHDRYDGKLAIVLFL